MRALLAHSGSYLVRRIILGLMLGVSVTSLYSAVAYNRDFVPGSTRFVVTATEEPSDSAARRRNSGNASAPAPGRPGPMAEASASQVTTGITGGRADELTVEAQSGREQEPAYESPDSQMQPSSAQARALAPGMSQAPGAGSQVPSTAKKETPPDSLPASQVVSPPTVAPVSPGPTSAQGSGASRVSSDASKRGFGLESEPGESRDPVLVAGGSLDSRSIVLVPKPASQTGNRDNVVKVTGAGDLVFDFGSLQPGARYVWLDIFAAKNVSSDALDMSISSSGAASLWFSTDSGSQWNLRNAQVAGVIASGEVKVSVQVEIPPSLSPGSGVNASVTVQASKAGSTAIR